MLVILVAVLVGASAATPVDALLPGQLPIPPEPTPLCGTSSAPTELEPGSLDPVPLPSEGLRIATYNVLHTQDAEGAATIDTRLDLLADEIAAQNPDALGLQEVSKSGAFGFVIEELAGRVATLTGQDWHWCWFASNPHVHYEPEPQPGGGGGPLTELAVQAAGQQTGNGNEFREGVALLARHPILDASVRRLTLRSHEAVACVPPDPIGCNFAALFDSRVVMHGRVAGVDLFTTHLAHGLTALSDDVKLRQVNDALARIAEVSDPSTPDVFVGDFNSVEGDDRWTAVTDAGFVDGFRHAEPGADGFTSGQDVLSDAATVSRRIDFVFVRGLQACVGDVFGDTPLVDPDGPGSPDIWPSDHYAVRVDLAADCPMV